MEKLYFGEERIKYSYYLKINGKEENVTKYMV